MTGRLAVIAMAALVSGAPLVAEPDQQIVVTGRGLAEAPADPAHDVVVIDRDALARAASGRIEDVLLGVAGFQQFRRSDSRAANPSAQGVTLRALGGNATSRALVLLDGVPLADPFFGYIPLSALDPGQLGRVRVARGGAAGAFAAGGVAGTIELDSANAAQLGPIGASGLIDDRGDIELSGSFAPRLGAGYAVLSGRWDRGRGFWTTPAAQRVPASVRAGYDSWNAGARMAAPLGGGVELQARIAAYDDQRVLRFAGANSASRGEDASLRLVGRGRWQFDLLGYVQAREFSNVVISSTSFRKTLDQRATPSTGLGAKLELRPPVGGGHLLRLGIDWRGADGTAFEDSYSQATGLVTARRQAGGHNGDLGLFAQDDWTAGRFILTGSLRVDRWTLRGGNFFETAASGAVTTATRFTDRAGAAVTARGGAVLRLTDTLSMRGAAYSGLRVPTLNELYRPFAVFPVTTRANAALAPERLRGFDLGVDWRPTAGVTLAATAFSDRLGDAIANVTIGPNLRERRNVGAISARGIELTVAAARGPLTLDGSLAWTDAQVEDRGFAAALDGKRPAQTPRIAASATLGWTPCRACKLALTLRHVGAQFEDDLETDVLPAATTLDAFAQLPLSAGVAVVMRGENLTDRAVVTRNQGGSIDIGAPRTLWLGFRFSSR